MSQIFTGNGEPIDTLAVSVDDMLLTAMARLDLLDDDSLSWLAKRCLGHASDADKAGFEPGHKAVYMAVVRLIEQIQNDPDRVHR